MFPKPPCPSSMGHVEAFPRGLPTERILPEASGEIFTRGQEFGHVGPTLQQELF